MSNEEKPRSLMPYPKVLELPQNPAILTLYGTRKSSILKRKLRGNFDEYFHITYSTFLKFGAGHCTISCRGDVTLFCWSINCTGIKSLHCKDIGKTLVKLMLFLHSRMRILHLKLLFLIQNEGCKRLKSWFLDS